MAISEAIDEKKAHPRDVEISALSAAEVARLSPDAAMARFAVSPAQGLSEAEAARRREKIGPNTIRSDTGKSLWLILKAQFIHPMMVLLLLMVVLSLLIGHFLDAAIVGVIILLNATIGFYQEWRAEKAMQSLKRLSAPKANVRRDGVVKCVPASEIVPGDVLVIEAGDLIPADVRWLEAVQLKIDEAILTGESVPVLKGIESITGSETALGDLTDLGFMGTHAVSGHGLGLCSATGAATELGRIADLVRTSVEGEVPLRKRLDDLTKRLVAAAFILCAIVIAAGVLHGESFLQLVLSAVSLGVASIPEGLPAVVTISLSLGAVNLVRRGVLVRQLQAVEALGSVTVIATDKTGTLTENRMRVKAITLGRREAASPCSFPSAEKPHSLIQALVLCNSATRGENGDTGDPMEIALLDFVRECGCDPAEIYRRHPRLHEIPFDSERKRMATQNRIDSGTALFVKGAPETVLPLCLREALDGEVRELNDKSRAELHALQEALARRGLRVLAAAMAHQSGADGEALEENLIFLGFVGLVDPPRKEVAEAIARCHEAGIRPVMITGDHALTAQAIAAEIGLYKPDGAILTGTDFAQAGEGELSEKISQATVFARVTPKDKLVIVEALRARGEIVAMTGDGVNDAPALKASDVGIAMGRGTDVAKEASDLVLLEENFAAIVNAIRHGRTIYDNIRKFVRYMLTTNLGEIATMLLVVLSGMPVPLLPVQILWINLITDGLPAVALGFEPAEPDVMRRRPRDTDESILGRGLWQHAVLIGLLMGVAGAGLFRGMLAFGQTEQAAQSLTFTALVFMQMAHVLGIRSDVVPLWRLGMLSNWRLTVALLGTTAAQFALLYIPPVARLFHLVPLSVAEILLSLAPAVLIYVVVETEKMIRRQG